MATEEQTPPKQERKDFFISYTSADRAWAEWIAWQLEEMGYRAVLQAWDFHAGGNFPLDMDRATKQAERTIAVLSPSYFASPFTPSEWAAAFRRDPKGEQGLLIPVRVRPCNVEGLLGQIIYVDLVDRTEQEALAVLLAEVQRRRRKPLSAPPFPSHPSIPRPDRFPGAPQPLSGQWGSKIRSSLHLATHADPDWERMLRRLRRSYKELLDQSLHGIAWVELGFSTRPHLVSNVATTNPQFRPQSDERLLAPGTRVLDAYDEAEGDLLILGAPGAGKSTLLLDLAQQLVERALADPAHPLPVILQLSSWAVGRPALDEWMIEQLSQTYDVPRKLSERWVRQEWVLPLLDGLDEMEEAARPACIAAINTYRQRDQTHLIPLVVCSRQAEYEAAVTRERLALQSAVLVQPLSDEQIEGYLQTAGPSFAGVRAALHQQPALWELATTPLILRVLLQTYQGASTPPLLQSETDLERQVWTDYITRQAKEEDHDRRYPLERRSTYLAFLAHQMRLHQQSIFYAEYLQSDWLPLDEQRTLTWLAIRLPAVVLGACVCLLVSLCLGNFQLLLQMGLLGGFVGGCLSQQVIAGPAHPTRHVFNEQLVSASLAVLPGLLLAASYGLFFAFGSPYFSLPSYSLSNWVRDGSIVGLGSGLSCWIFQRLLSRNPGSNVSKNARGFWGMAPRSVWLRAAVLGAGIGLSAGLSIGLRDGWFDGMYDVLSNGLSISITTVLLSTMLADSMGSLQFAERIRWTWRGLLRWKHLRTSLSIAGVLFLTFGLGDGLIDGLRYGVSNGLYYGLSVGLSYWIVFGLYQGMKREHLEDQGRQQFNQGIRRSLRNGLLLGLISALILSAIAVLSDALSYGVSFGLYDGLRHGVSYEIYDGLRYGLRYVWLWLLTSLVVMWALCGGLTILRHYVIRALLARSQTFPWRVQAFLDDATTRILLRRVGGGYGFIHSRLQDYFADPAAPPSQN